MHFGLHIQPQDQKPLGRTDINVRKVKIGGGPQESLKEWRRLHRFRNVLYDIRLHQTLFDVQWAF
jgi:hypothetical protein